MSFVIGLPLVCGVVPRAQLVSTPRDRSVMRCSARCEFHCPARTCRVRSRPCLLPTFQVLKVLCGAGGASGFSSFSSSSANAASCCATWAFELESESPRCLRPDFYNIVGFPSFVSTSKHCACLALCQPPSRVVWSAVIAPSLLCLSSSILVSLYLSTFSWKASCFFPMQPASSMPASDQLRYHLSNVQVHEA